MQILGLKKMDITQSHFYQEIRAESEANLLVRQLTRRFGALSENQARQIQQLSMEQLEMLGRRC